MLEADVRLRVGAFALDAALTAVRGEVVVLVGPNGAGKTTLLRILAGLQRPDAGRVAIDGETVDGDGVFVAAHRRGVGLVPQHDRLLPHLDARSNVAFGLRRAGMRRVAADAEAARWLGVVGLGDAASKRPAELSGGQAKRVALARALAVRPRVLLMDEPFAGLDATTRREVRRELRSYLDAQDGVRILVTHEVVDALALADRVIVLEHGRVVQDVAPEQLRVRPRSRYVADLVGVNLYRGTFTASGIRTEGGAQIVAAGAGTQTGAGLATIHPRSVSLHREQPEGSPRNVWRGTVGEVDDEGDRLRVRVDGPIVVVAEVTPSAAAELGLAVGVNVHASVKATEVALYPA